ncbi:response regulator [Ponticoccus sp. SC2-23]|nr:response regulator [Ponticoccus sp. SC6-9]MBM1227467.1 response regulator [Ponticoccus sp. SC6-15]MBM1231977.1 response regulator [Ponticoccus sp. SC6-38]MBM1236490.1 response regulator [Ponticoccus sp. SC6-45]MBM1240996.1 response regulator [Ponticoccus sp. SC6-49]MBM1245507.1 response regulator [Ponticoccus sp. SC2-64]MBM1250009.1 response regulator [Ponticoccus sp. SC6-42]MBM1254496.1 response regulator [Ponticoccus sp. SC6-33]MBM1259004.1 response regulator [Ponticoccus sp. SC6-60]M
MMTTSINQFKFSANSTDKSRIGRWLLVALPAVSLTCLALIVATASRKVEIIDELSDSAFLAAAFVDSRLSLILEITEECASTLGLDQGHDYIQLSESCQLRAAGAGDWVVVVELGETHRQIVNSSAVLGAPLPRYPRDEEYPQLIRAENESRLSGEAVIADVFQGLVNPRGVISAGRWVELDDGRSVMVYTGIEATSISDDLDKLVTDNETLLVVDGSQRVIATSGTISEHLFKDISLNVRQEASTRTADKSGPNVTTLQRILGTSSLTNASEWQIIVYRDEMRHFLGASESFAPLVLALLGFLGTAGMVTFYSQKRITEERIQFADCRRAEAEKNHAEKNRLLASFAHDIRNPLISLLGSLELSRDAADSSNAETATQAVESILEQIDDVAEIAFLGSAEFTLHPTLVDISELAHKVFDLYYPLADQKGLKFELNVDDSLPSTILVDRLRLRQVLDNLVSNAIKYTEIGIVSLKIKVLKIDDDSISLRFSVVDSGPGLRTKDLPIIFKEYGRLDVGMSIQQEGAGLGLAICNRVLQHYASSINVESEPGIGSCFFFDLELPYGLDEMIGVPDQALKDLVIIYAEDEPVIRQITVARLEEHGPTVVAVSNGVEALEALAKTEPDLMLLDLQMPDMYGLETIKYLSGSAPARDFPIFILTSHIAGLMASEAEAAGADAVFTKPIQIHAMAAAFRAGRLKESSNTYQFESDTRTDYSVYVVRENFLSAVGLADEAEARDFADRIGRDMTNKLDDLRAAVLGGHMSLIDELSHKLLGLSQVLGASAMCIKLRAIQETAKENDLEAARRLVAECGSMLSRTLAEMRMLVEKRLR